MNRVFAALILGVILSWPAQAVTLKIATLAPDGTSWMRAMREAAREVEEDTGGRIRLRFYPGGVMGNDKSVLRKIRVGQLHGGAVTSSGLGDLHPDVQVYSLPFLFRSYEEVDYLRARMDPLLARWLAAAGFASFGVSEGGFAYLMSSNPLPSVEDLRKQKVWVPEGDRISLAAFEAVGVSPVPLPLSDVLTGLQTRLIDTVGSTPAALIALQWHTQVRYITDVPLLYTYGALVIKERALGGLSPADRTALETRIEAAFRKLNSESRDAERAALDALAGEGIEPVRPSAEGLEQWRSQVRDAMDRLAEEGVIGAQALETARRHLEELRRGGG